MFEEVRKVFNRYKGTIEETDRSLTLRSKNDIFGHKIECDCSISLLDSKEWPYAVDVCEKTYQKLGGRGYPCKTIKEAVYVIEECLKAFNFEEERQMSLFDYEY